MVVLDIQFACCEYSHQSIYSFLKTIKLIKDNIPLFNGHSLLLCPFLFISPFLFDECAFFIVRFTTFYRPLWCKRKKTNTLLTHQMQFIDFLYFSLSFSSEYHLIKVEKVSKIELYFEIEQRNRLLFPLSLSFVFYWISIAFCIEPFEALIAINFLQRIFIHSKHNEFYEH